MNKFLYAIAGILTFLELAAVNANTVLVTDSPTDATIDFTSEVDGTTGSGFEPTDSNVTTTDAISTAMPVDPCSSNPCRENSICTPGADGAYTCPCEEEYEEVESQCVKTECDGKVETVSNVVVYYDANIDACGNTSYYPPPNVTVAVYFSKTPVGTTVVSNVTCNTSCVDGDSNTISKAIGVVSCEAGGTFSTPNWIDCSETDPGLNQKLTSAIIETSNPSDVDESIVTDSVKVLEEVAAQDDVTTQSADDFLAVTNNLLQASNDGAKDAMQESAEKITNSVQQVAKKVELKSADPQPYSYYEKEQSDIAMAVVEPTATRSARTTKAEGTYYYGTNGARNSNLAVTNLEISSHEPNGSYISAIPNAGSRVSFVIYSNVNDLFPNNDNFDILSTNIVYGVGNGEVTMRFPITENIDITSENKFGDSKKLDCLRWGKTKWETAGSTCTSYRASNSFASCTCNGEGEYTIRAVKLDVVDEGLSPGAIAGIVIGSLAGVALIGGLAYYFYYRKNSGY